MISADLHIYIYIYIYIIYIDTNRRGKHKVIASRMLHTRPAGKKKRKELINHIECRDVLVECKKLVAVNRNVCGAAEAPEQQAGK